MAEDYYQTNIMDYLHIYSVHGVCQRSVQRSLLFTAYLIRGRLWPFAPCCFAVLFSCPYLPLVRNSPFWNIRNYYFPPFYLLIFQFIYGGI